MSDWVAPWSAKRRKRATTEACCLIEGQGGGVELTDVKLKRTKVLLYRPPFRVLDEAGGDALSAVMVPDHQAIHLRNRAAGRDNSWLELAYV